MSRLFSVFVASTLAVVAMTVSAMADGMGGSIKDAPPAPEVYQWNGLSVGVGIGAGRTDTSISVDADKTATKEKRKCEKRHSYGYHYYYDCDNADWQYVDSWTKYLDPVFDSDKWNGFGTLQVGYDRLLGSRILVGAFADFDFYVDADRAFSSYDHYGKSHKWVDGDLELKNVWSVGGRLGFLVTPRVLLYGVGGYTEAGLDGTASASFKWDGNPTHTVSMNLPDELKGYFVGGGAELKIHKNVSLKLEYRYSNFGTESTSAHSEANGYPSGCGSANYWSDRYCYQHRVNTELNARSDLDMDIHSVRAALVLKLGDVHDRPVESLK